MRWLREVHRWLLNHVWIEFRVWLACRVFALLDRTDGSEVRAAIARLGEDEGIDPYERYLILTGGAAVALRWRHELTPVQALRKVHWGYLRQQAIEAAQGENDATEVS